MKITSLVPKTDNWYQHHNFLPFLESHLTFLKEQISNIQDIPDNTAARYVGDFYGLLTYLGLPFDLHYIALRLNGFTNSSDYEGLPMTVLLPNTTQMESLRNVYKTTQKQ